MYLVEEKKNKIWKRLGLAILIIISLAAVFGAGLYLPGRSEAARELAREEAVYLGKILGKYSQPGKDILTQDVNFGLFWDVWDTLKKEYVDKDKLNEKELFYGAIKGMVASASDPYTVFLDPKMTREFEEDLAGTFEGIGAEIGIRNGVLSVIAPLSGTPAEKAGLKAGDKIYAINGESTAGLAVDEAVKKIRGSRGTTVTLTVSRDGIEKAKETTITRDTIVVKSVTAEEKDGIYVVKIASFGDETVNLFNGEVIKILEKDPRGIIIDLRNNPGGYLDAAIDIVSEWIDNGVVVTEKFSEDKKIDYSAKGRARLKDYKTAVLANEGSASASEIVAGALKDYGKATIVGEKTFGKGSVQAMESFVDGSSVKITVAKWLTPKGNDINEKGIEPDMKVEMTEEDYDANKDPQMEKAIQQLGN